MKKISQTCLVRFGLLAGAVLCAAGALTARASGTYVTFSVDMATNIAGGTFVPGTDTLSVHGTFDGWSAGLTLVQQGGGTVYTNTINDTTDANGATMQYKFVDSNAGVGNGGYENLPTGQNRAAKLPATSGASLVLPTPFFNDAGAAVTNDVTFQVDVSQQIALGNFTPGTDYVVIRGGLINNWSGTAEALTNDTSILVTNQYGLVTSNVWVGTFPITTSPAGMVGFKYVIPNHAGTGDEWESPGAANQDGGGNRYFANVPQTLPIVDFSDAPYSPVASLAFSVDMTIVQLTDTNFNPTTVTIWGDFNGWSGGVAMTNDPNASNTNLFTTSSAVQSGAGSTINYQFRYATLSDGSTIYDHLNGANGGQGNRIYIVPAVTSTNVPTVFFNDASLNDYLLQPTPVLFSVDMTGAVGTDAHVFDPNSDGLYVNGQFANWYAWAGGLNPAPAPPGYQLFQQGSSMIFTNIVVMPAGTPVAFAYKYGMDPGNAAGGPADDEAGFAQNHFRVVRSTAINPYPMTDKFGNQYSEPYFSSGNTAGGNLMVGAASGGAVPVQWLGRPGARLQWTTNLNGGDWQQVVATDGTNWSAGYYSTNGFVSQTNWPATDGNVFFRLVKP